MPAIRTLFGDGFRRRSEFALRIISAAVKSISLARALFNELAFFAFGTLYANEVLLHVFALGISAGRRELAKTAVPQDQVAFAQRAGFIERNVRHSLALIETPRRLAIGIAGAGHELAEAPALQDHDASTVFAVFLLRGFLYIGRIVVGKINAILFGELAGVRVLLILVSPPFKQTTHPPL